jgi:DNA-binding GntR family transcriptional regulator
MIKMKSKKIIVYNNLKKRIIKDSLKPLEPLNIQALSQSLNISKTPIREALQQLEKEGFVENLHNRGFFVSRISAHDLREIYEVREMIECAAVRALALRNDKLKFEFPEFNKGKNSNNLLKDSAEIHSYIIRILNNKRLTGIYDSLQEHVQRLQMHFINRFDQNRLQHSHEEHKRIYEAIIAKDVLKAEEAMRMHLRNALDYLRELV